MQSPAFLPPALLLASRAHAERRNLCGNPRHAFAAEPAAAAHPRRAILMATPSTNAAKKRQRNWSPRVENRIARMRYEFLDLYECGIELVGTEIKSVRHGSLNIKEGYARVANGELFLHNVHITPWENASSYFNHEAVRVRKLLLHKRDIRKLAGRQKDTGLTIVPTKAYFNKGGYLKIEIALARGKQEHDRREDIKKRENDREMRSIVKSSMSAL
jgi:SsrA-binding protein